MEKKQNITKKDLLRQIRQIQIFIKETLNPMVMNHNGLLIKITEFLDKTFPPEEKKIVTPEEVLEEEKSRALVLLLQVLCQSHDCSNDSSEPPIYGDELIKWDQLANWSTRIERMTPETERCFEIVQDMTTVQFNCEREKYNPVEDRWSYIPPNTHFNPYAVNEDFFPRWGLEYKYCVRSCVGLGTAEGTCGAWAPNGCDDPEDGVFFIGGVYSCFSFDGERCELQCEISDPLNFPEINECQN